MRKHRIFLVAPEVGIVQGTECVSMKEAKLLLYDRKANGDAFKGERVARIPVEIFAPSMQNTNVYGKWSLHIEIYRKPTSG